MSWNARFGFFWYNDEEIFKFKEEDFDNKAKRFADAGINIVITFSCTHFRWTMLPYWDKINKCLENIVKACHKYGIKVVEHHSSHLTFDPLDSQDWDYMERILNKRQSSIDSWEGIRDHLAKDPIINGHSLSSFRQIDGRTGKWARSCYHGYAMCFNNPNYRQAYFSYLESIYKTGVDGIMTDDVQWFGDGNACSCQYCRGLFKQQTGYDLPQPGEAWHKFHGDYDNPVYIAWETFRRNSTANFQYEVNKHFKSLGLNLLRPNYVSHSLLSNPTGYPFDTAASIWDYVFQENYYSSIIRYSWPAFAMEAVHRYALGDRNSVPSMSMFYPDREDSMYFSWALARSWGQMCLVTPEGKDLSHVEKKFIDFERKHSHILDNLKKHAEIGFYFSIKTRDYIKDSAERNMSVLYSWMQSAYLKNYSIDLVFEYDKIEKLMQYPVIVLPNVSMMSEIEMDNLRKYMQNGGKLLIIGIPGLKDENGALREQKQIIDIMGLREDTSIAGLVFANLVSDIDNLSMKKRCTFNYNNININITIDSSKTFYAFSGVPEENIVMKTDKGDITGIQGRVGKGQFIWLIDSFGNEIRQPEMWADRWFDHEIRVPSPEYAVDRLKRILGKVIDSMIDDRLIYVSEELNNEFQDIIVTCFTGEKESRHIIHLVNTIETLPQESCDIGHSDIIPAFTGSRKYELKNSMDLQLRKLDSRKIGSVRLYTPEKEGYSDINYEEDNSGKAIIKIPANSFEGYAIVEVEYR